ncbi:MAG: hypothetical protein PHC84_01580 [Clostridia bacterium]|nr:hypothetical protein [Clostridia bacterium]
MKKYLIIITLLAVSACIFCLPTVGYAFADVAEETGLEVRSGYLAEITYGNFNMANGSIVRTFSVTFDEQFLDGFGEDDAFGREELLNYVSGYILAIGFTPETAEDNRVIGSRVYDSTTDLYLEYGIDGYESNDSDYVMVKSFFFTDVHINQKTIFDGIEDEGSLGMLLGILYMFDLGREDVALSYHYGSPYKIITTDAERSYFDVNSEIYVHEFYMDLDSSGREIEIVQQIPNATNWYVVAIAVTLPIILASLIGLAIAKHKQKRRANYAG